MYPINKKYLYRYFYITFQVSNRLPFILSRRKQKFVSKYDGVQNENTSRDFVEPLYRKSSAGGLVTAVAPVMVQSGGKRINRFFQLLPINK